MGNKVKYNLKNVHAAKLTETVADGVTAFTYAAPKAIPGAVSISLDAEGESSPFYADGIVYFRSVTNNGYSGDLEIALIPEWFRTEILQEESISYWELRSCSEFRWMRTSVSRCFLFLSAISGEDGTLHWGHG